MITQKQKRVIYGQLISSFEKEVDIPLASLALFFNSKHISYSEFGYKKIKPFLNSLEFLSLKTKENKGHKDEFVVIHDFDVDHKEEEKMKSKKDHKKVKLALTEHDRNKIYSAFLSEFDEGTPIPLSQVNATLMSLGYSYKEYKHTKLAQFLLDINPTIRIEKRNNIQYMMLLKPVKKEMTNKKKETGEILKDDINFPDNLLLPLKEIGLRDFTKEEALDLVYKSYLLAKNNGQVETHDYGVEFPIQNKDLPEAYYCGIRKATTRIGKKYYVAFLSSDRERPKETLDRMVQFDDFEKSIQELASLARKEKWCYKGSRDPYLVLKIYLQYTFHRIVKQDKLAESPNMLFAAFNTGLINSDYEPIYGILVLKPQKEKEYHFEGFTTRAQQGLGKILIEHFNPLPKPATYLNKEDFFFDPQQELHTDVKHIIYDNLDRFPLHTLSLAFLPCPEAKQVLLNLSKSNNPNAREKNWNVLKKLASSNLMVYEYLRFALESAIEKAKRIVSYDYRFALPSFFPTRNAISLMLPLEFDPNYGIEAVLLVEKTQSGNYQGQTILTLKQCYVNARLISPLENTFLDPDKINDQGF